MKTGFRSGQCTGVIAAMAVAASLAPGLAASQAEPQARAEVVYVKGTDGTGLGVSALQYYANGAEGTCEGLKLAAKFGPMSGKEKRVQTAAGTPVHVFGVTEYVWTAHAGWTGTGAYAGLDNSLCAEGVSFVPEAGHAYIVAQRTRFGDDGCRIQVTDSTTGAEVKTEVVPKLANCRISWGKFREEKPAASSATE